MPLAESQEVMGPNCSRTAGHHHVHVEQTIEVPVPMMQEQHVHVPKAWEVPVLSRRSLTLFRNLWL